MLEKIWEYLKHSITVAWKSVFFHFRQYFCFFLAVLIVEVLYGMVAVSAVNGNAAEYRHITDEYKYHLTLKGLNSDQAWYVINYGASPFKSNKFYDVVSYETYIKPVTGETQYDIFLFFNTGDAEYCLDRFEKTYQIELSKLGAKDSNFSKERSPLMDYGETVEKNRVTFFLISLVLFVLCVFLLTSLYRIRINHYKFEYGIYLTYGADFKMLFSTAFWELFIIFFVTYIPAMGLSTLLSYLIYSVTNYGFLFSGAAFWQVALFTVLAIVCAVWLPMKALSVRQPMSLILAEDNSNLVSSPRSSVSIFGEKFPTRYEFYSLWRFRKYNLQVLTTATVFCAMFIMALYCSNVYRTNVEYNRPQFTISLSNTGYVYDDIMSEELYAIKGVTAVEIDDTAVEALDIASHVLLRGDNILLSQNDVAYEGKTFDTNGKDWRATNEFVYNATPEEQISILQNYEHTGNLSCLKRSGYVVVGDAKNNVKSYEFEVGDKIQVAVRTGQIRAIDSNETGRVLLKNQIKFFRFRYIEFIVGAVLTDIPCGSTPIFFSPLDYEAVTGITPESKKISIYTDPTLTPEENAELYQEIRTWAHSYGGIRVSDNDVNLNRNVARDRHYGELFLVIALMILIISPLVWFFSQSLYYAKREKEFNILQSLGAVASEIRQIYLQGGLCMAIFSLLSSVLLSYLGSYLVFLFCNVVIPLLTGESIRYSFYMPWYAIVTSVVVSVLCGFFSTYLPFRSYYKNRFSLANGGAGADYGADE